MIISVPLHLMSEWDFFRTYQRRGWRSGWNSRKGLQLTLPGKGRGDSEATILGCSTWRVCWLEQGRDWWYSYRVYHEIKKNYIQKMIMKKHSTHGIRIHHAYHTECPWNPSNKKSTIRRRCPFSLRPARHQSRGLAVGSWQWVKGRLRIPRNPCRIQAAWILSIITVRVRKEQFFFGQDWKWWILFICHICFDFDLRHRII